MHARAAAQDSDFICFQHGCLHCPGALFPEDTLIKESLYWRIAKCFSSERWPRTRGTEKKKQRWHSVSIISFSGNQCRHFQQSFETSTEVFHTHTHKKKGSTPPPKHGPPTQMIPSCLIPIPLVYFLARTPPQHTAKAIWRLQGRFVLAQVELSGRCGLYVELGCNKDWHCKF